MVDDFAGKIGERDAEGRVIKHPTKDLIGNQVVSVPDTLQLDDRHFVVLPVGYNAEEVEKILDPMRRSLGISTPLVTPVVAPDGYSDPDPRDYGLGVQTPDEEDEE